MAATSNFPDWCETNHFTRNKRHDCETLILLCLLQFHIYHKEVYMYSKRTVFKL